MKVFEKFVQFFNQDWRFSSLSYDWEIYLSKKSHFNFSSYTFPRKQKMQQIAAMLKLYARGYYLQYQDLSIVLIKLSNFNMYYWKSCCQNSIWNYIWMSKTTHSQFWCKLISLFQFITLCLAGKYDIDPGSDISQSSCT